MNKSKAALITRAALIAAIYVILTYVFSGISFGQFQIRIAEALCVLPYFTPAAIPGLFVGCLIGNILGGAMPADVIFGSLATLAAALVTRGISLRNTSSEGAKRCKWLLPLPAIIINSAVIPLVLRFTYGIDLPIIFLILLIFAGELVSCGIIGIPFFMLMNKYRNVLFKQ